MEPEGKTAREKKMNRGRRGCGAEETERDETRTERGGRWGGEGDREEEKRRLAAGAVRSKVVFETRGGNRIAGKEREREREDTGRLALSIIFLFFLFFFFFSPSFALLPFPPSHLILPPLSSFSLFLLFTREATIPGEKCRGKGRGREREREKKEESRGSRVVCPRYRRARLKGTHGRMVHMDLEMFAGRAVQILIKRNIFRMRAPTGTGETKRRVPFLILSRHAWKNASPSIPTPSGSMTFGFALYPFPVSFHLPSDLSIVIRSVDSL